MWLLLLQTLLLYKEISYYPALSVIAVSVLPTQAIRFQLQNHQSLQLLQLQYHCKQLENWMTYLAVVIRGKHLQPTLLIVMA